ncbi:hypothetical protein [Pluralibacter gergoviae]|nr:hypothetical protein [Pluralibacter gergoviae]
MTLEQRVKLLEEERNKADENQVALLRKAAEDAAISLAKYLKQTP